MTPVETVGSPPSYRWWFPVRGDIDVTIAQVGFNLAQMVIPVFLLAPVGIPIAFSVSHLLPGYALGFLVGSLGLVRLAVNLARREGRQNVTAHVYGNNVPAIVAYTLSIMLPVYLQSRDAALAWAIGAAAVAWTGIVKLAAAPFAGAIRRLIPGPASMTVFGAAMYSYLALVLLQRVFDQPFVGLIALAIIVTSVLGNLPITRWRIPPFIVAWLIPLAVGIGVGYVHPVWPGVSLTAPFAIVPGTGAGDDSGAAVYVRDRADGVLSRVAGYRVGRGRQRRRGRLRRAQPAGLGRSRDSGMRPGGEHRGAGDLRHAAAV